MNIQEVVCFTAHKCFSAMKIVLLFVFTCNFQRFLGQNCGGIAGNVCCNGYYWNATLQSCQPCSVGFTGHNCLETCRYPGYGRECQMTCHCTQPFCSHIGGCSTSNEGYAGEIERDKICCNNKSYSIEEKNNKQNLTTYENIMENPVSLAISCLFLFERDPWTKKLNTRELVSRSPLSRSSSSEASSTTRQHNCTKSTHSSKNSSGIYTSVISLTAISGVLLLLYIGLHCYMTRFQTKCLPPATSAI